MKEKCKNCAHPSKSCVSFIMTLTTQETLEWCRMWKERYGWSSATLATKANIPVGTVTRVLSHADDEGAGVKLATIRPIICALTGCTLEELESCESHTETDGVMMAKLEHQADTIRRLEVANARLRDTIADNDVKRQKQVDFLKAELAHEQGLAKTRLRIIRLLVIPLVVMFFIFAFAVIVDWLNSDIDFFWLGELSAFFSNAKHNVTDAIMKWKLY